MPTNKKGYMGDYYNKNKEKWNNPTEIAKRVERNKARAMFEKKVGVSTLKGKDVDHIKPLSSGGKTTAGNLRLLSVSKNRGRK